MRTKPTAASCPLDGLGFSGRRFPFRAETPCEDKALEPDINQVLLWSQSRISFVAMTFARTYSLRPQEWDDIEAKVLERLWKALPRYDVTRSDIQSFIYVVIDSRIRDGIKAVLNARKRNASNPLDFSVFTNGNPDEVAVSRAYRLAELIQSDPTSFFGDEDARLYREIHDSINGKPRTRQQTADALGIARETVTRRVGRMAEAILQIWEEGQAA